MIVDVSVVVGCFSRSCCDCDGCLCCVDVSGAVVGIVDVSVVVDGFRSICCDCGCLCSAVDVSAKLVVDVSGAFVVIVDVLLLWMFQEQLL